MFSHSCFPSPHLPTFPCISHSTSSASYSPSPVVQPQYRTNLLLNSHPFLLHFLTLYPLLFSHPILPFSCHSKQLHLTELVSFEETSHRWVTAWATCQSVIRAPTLLHCYTWEEGGGRIHGGKCEGTVCKATHHLSVWCVGDHSKLRVHEPVYSPPLLLQEEDMEDQSGTEWGPISSSAIALSSSALFLASCSLSSLCWTGIETYTILGGLGYLPTSNALFKL